MDATMTDKLTRLQNYRTRYELAAVHPDGRRVLIVYSAGRSRRNLYSCVSDAKRGAALVALTKSEAITFAKRASDGATMGEWRIIWTGRTQREAILAGELPFVIAGFNAGD